MLKRLVTLMLALGLIFGGIGLSYTPVNAQGEDPPPPTEEVTPPEGSVTGTLTQTIATTQTLTTEPTEQATEEPTAEPTEEATEPPTAEPTEEATEPPTAEPTEEATEPPTAEPTEEATEPPTAEPTEEATAEPTVAPTQEPATTTVEPGIAAVVNPPAQTSHVLLQNTSTNTADVSVTVYDTTGASIFSDSFQIAGKGSRTLHASAGTNTAGALYMNLSATQSSMVVESTERLVAANINFGSPTAHHIYEGLDSDSISTDVLVPSVHWREAQWSLVGVQNAGTAPANVEIRYYRQDGSLIKMIPVNGLGVGVSSFRNTRNDIGTCVEPCVGSMRVTSTNGQSLAVAVMETLYSYTESYTGIPVSAADTKWNLPAVHRNTGGQYSHILVQNTESGSANIKLTYYDQNGTMVDQFTGIIIPGNGSLTFHTTNDNSTNGQNYTPTNLGNVGSAVVESTNNVKVVVKCEEVIGFLPNGAPYSYNGFNSSAGATTVLLPSVHRNLAGQFSHALVQNASTTESNHIRITYYNQDGSVANTFEKTLNPAGAITFHTTNDPSTDGQFYTPTNLNIVGSAEIVSLDNRDILAVVIETVTGLPGSYAGFK